MKRKAGKYEKKKDDDLLKKNPVRFDYDNADIMDDKDEEDEDVDDDKPPKDLGAKTVSKKRSRLQHNYYSVMTDDDLVNKEISSPKGLFVCDRKRQERKKVLASKEADSIPSEEKLEQSEPSLHPQSQSGGIVKKRSRRKNYSDMTNDELVNLCHLLDRPRARRVVHDLRKYILQILESEGFDIDVFPGYFNGLTTIIPAKYSKFCSMVNDDPEWLAESVINVYNLDNAETKYKVESVEQMNVYTDACCTYYITFCARDVNKANGDLKTFQAIAEVQWLEPGGGTILGIPLCRLKPDGDHKVSSPATSMD
ncbi:hypothetical protein OROHE_021257 [Orobanche hederae]